MQIELHMVGHHKNSNINIKGVQFKSGKATVTGADELVGNICKYLEAYGAFQPHIAERKQAEIDGVGDLLGIRSAKRMQAKAEEMMKEANEKILRAQEAVEERLQAESNLEREAAAAALLAAKERKDAAEEKAEALNGEVENRSSSEGRSSQSSSHQKDSKQDKSKNR
jgi:hypothetical protein